MTVKGEFFYKLIGTHLEVARISLPRTVSFVIDKVGRHRLS